MNEKKRNFAQLMWLVAVCFGLFMAGVVVGYAGSAKTAPDSAENAGCYLGIGQSINGYEFTAMLPIAASECGQLEFVCGAERDVLWKMLDCRPQAMQDGNGSFVCYCDQTPVEDAGGVRV